MVERKILFDGWSLVHQPLSPAAIHLLAVLDRLPEEAHAILVLPGKTIHHLPGNLEIRVLPNEPGSAKQLLWEQWMLPRLAKKYEVNIVHLCSLSAALFQTCPTVFSAVGYPSNLYSTWLLKDVEAQARGVGVVERFRKALAYGGLARVNGLIWPSDLPKSSDNLPVMFIPPFVHSKFTEDDKPVHPPELDVLNLPEYFVLYHGPDRSADLERLCESWRWAAGTIGSDFPLILVGLNPQAQQIMPALAVKIGIEKTIRILPYLSLESLVFLYRQCSALFHPATVSPWGNSLRLALACAKPVVAPETPHTDALIGPAGYLVPRVSANTALMRAFGAALISVVTNEELSEQLASSARRRTTGWNLAYSQQCLLELYRKF